MTDDTRQASERPFGLFSRLILSALAAAVAGVTLWVVEGVCSNELPHPVYMIVSTVGNEVLLEWVRYLAAPPTLERFGFGVVVQFPIYYLTGIGFYALAGLGLTNLLTIVAWKRGAVTTKR